MRRYVPASGVIFGLMGTVQLVRAVMRLPVLVADIVIPIWASWCASLFFLMLAAWAWRASRHGA